MATGVPTHNAISLSSPSSCTATRPSTPSGTTTVNARDDANTMRAGTVPISTVRQGAKVEATPFERDATSGDSPKRMDRSEVTFG